MDLNFILSRHQISLMRAAGATTPEARNLHRGFAVGYAAQIGRLRQASGATFALAPQR